MFDRHRQPWQCSIIIDCGEKLMILPASCSHSVVVTMGNCRHKIKVLDIPQGGGGLWSQVTSA